jgi:hypothetical protein
MAGAIAQPGQILRSCALRGRCRPFPDLDSIRLSYHHHNYIRRFKLSSREPKETERDQYHTNPGRRTTDPALSQTKEERLVEAKLLSETLSLGTRHLWGIISQASLCPVCAKNSACAAAPCLVPVHRKSRRRRYAQLTAGLSSQKKPRPLHSISSPFPRWSSEFFTRTARPRR